MSTVTKRDLNQRTSDVLAKAAEIGEYSAAWVPLIIAVRCQSILRFGAGSSAGERRPFVGSTLTGS